MPTLIVQVYTILIIRSAAVDNAPAKINRRYSDVSRLHNSLRRTFPTLMRDIRLPPKQLSGNYKPETIARRSRAFEQYLGHVFSIDALRTVRFLLRQWAQRRLSAYRERRLFRSRDLAEADLEAADKVGWWRWHVVYCDSMRCGCVVRSQWGWPDGLQPCWTSSRLHRFESWPPSCATVETCHTTLLETRSKQASLRTKVAGFAKSRPSSWRLAISVRTCC
jgi:PX domain